MLTPSSHSLAMEAASLSTSWRCLESGITSASSAVGNTSPPLAMRQGAQLHCSSAISHHPITKHNKDDNTNTTSSTFSLSVRSASLCPFIVLVMLTPDMIIAKAIALMRHTFMVISVPTEWSFILVGHPASHQPSPA